MTKITRNDMIVSYVFNRDSLELGGLYKFKYGNYIERKGVLTKISSTELEFYVPRKKSQYSCSLEPTTISASDFYNDTESYIEELS